MALSARFYILYSAVTSGAGAAELRIGLSADVTTLDSAFVAAQPNLTVQQHIFDGLYVSMRKVASHPGWPNHGRRPIRSRGRSSCGQA